MAHDRGQAKSRARKIVVAWGLSGVVLAVVFSALGGFSPEPSDHPSWLDNPPLVVALIYQGLAFLCLPAFVFSCWVALPILYSLIPTAPESLGGYVLADLLGMYLVFPLTQGLLYAAVGWLLLRMKARRFQFSLARLLCVTAAVAGLIGVGAYVNGLWKGWQQPSLSIGPFLISTLLFSALAYVLVRRLLKPWVAWGATIVAGGITGACFTWVAYDDPLLLAILGMVVGVCWLVAVAAPGRGSDSAK